MWLIFLLHFPLRWHICLIMEGPSSLLFLWQYGVSMFFCYLIACLCFLRLLFLHICTHTRIHTHKHTLCINSTVKSLACFVRFIHSWLLWEFNSSANPLVPKALTFLYWGVCFSCWKLVVIIKKKTGTY